MTHLQEAIGRLPTLRPSTDGVFRDTHGEDRDSFARSVAEGLAKPLPALEHRLLYDAEGSRLFELITNLPEYYPTRAEASILERHAGEIADLAGPIPLVELGAGSGRKTSLLIDAFESRYDSGLYVPVDVSKTALDMALQDLSSLHGRTRIVPVHGLHASALSILERLRPALGVFLGSSIGNFTEEEENSLYQDLGQRLRGGGAFLLGVDLVKDPALIERAYNDSEGVTATFIGNLFRRIRRELGARIDMNGFQCDARYVEERERVEIYARFGKSISLRVDDLAVEVEAGKPILVEICRKFRLEAIEDRLEKHGLELVRTFLDRNGWFADLLIAHRRKE